MCNDYTICRKEKTSEKTENTRSVPTMFIAISIIFLAFPIISLKKIASHSIGKNCAKEVAEK